MSMEYIRKTYDVPAKRGQWCFTKGNQELSPDPVERTSESNWMETQNRGYIIQHGKLNMEAGNESKDRSENH